MSYDWDTSEVQEGDKYLIKVQANDEKLTTVDISDSSFTIERESTTTKDGFFVPGFRLIEFLSTIIVMVIIKKRQRVV